MSGLKFSRCCRVVAAMTAVFAVAACGGNGGDGGGGGSTAGATQGSTDQSANVPTLDELYKGLSTAPPTEGPPVAKDKSLWFVTCSSAVASCQQPAVSGKEAAEKLGWKATVVDGKYDQGGAWSAGITGAVAAGADGLVLVGLDCQNVQQPIRQARDAGLHILSVYTSDCDPPLFDVAMMYGESIPSTDAWDYQIGANSANYVIAKSNGKAKILASHNTSEKAPQIVDKGFKETLEANCPDCKIVNSFGYQSVEFVPNGPWIQNLRSQLTKFGSQADAVFLQWDVMSAELGGAAAVREAGLKDALVFGGLGLPQTLDQVRQDKLTAVTAAMSQDWVGYAAVDEMNRAFNGEKSVPEGLGFAIVDKTHNLPPAGQPYEPDVDWKAAYQKLWGM